MSKYNQKLILNLNTAAANCDVMTFIDLAVEYYTAEGLSCPSVLSRLLSDEMTRDEKVREMQKLTILIHNATVMN